MQCDKSHDNVGKNYWILGFKQEYKHKLIPEHQLCRIRLQVLYV